MRNNLLLEMRFFLRLFFCSIIKDSFYLKYYLLLKENLMEGLKDLR